MSESSIRRYFEIKQEIAKLEDELALIKEKVFQAVEEAGGKYEAEQYVLRTQKRPRYVFSAEYQAKEKELKSLKHDEIESGLATVEGYTEFVTLKLND